jgi:uncharacterized integral membrane protein (TIGR00697 family)
MMSFPDNYAADAAKAARMKADALTFCSLLFVGSLFVADITSVKLFSYEILGFHLLVPGGTLAFAATFLATDVICEVTGNRATANRVVFMGLALRVLALLYYHLIIGDAAGHLPLLDTPGFWKPENQQSLVFVLGGSARIALAGLVSASISFLNDTYVFNTLRQKYKNRNLYWLRNAATTMLSQIINSVIFVSLAFGAKLTVTQILGATLGQIVWKVAFAWADTPLAYLLRNYGQGRTYWYAFWKKEFYTG